MYYCLGLGKILSTLHLHRKKKEVFLSDETLTEKKYSGYSITMMHGIWKKNQYHHGLIEY